MLDLVLPERCAICETPGRPLCDRCRTTLTQAHAAGLRALRLSGPVAGPTLCRVRGEEARVRACPVRDRLRRPGAEVRALVEGARPPAARARCRGARCRGRSEAAGGRARPGAGRPGARVAPGRRPVACARDRAREHLGARDRRRAGAEPRASASARAGARRAPQERPRQRRRVAEPFPRRSASSTTSTPPAQRRTPARAPAGGSGARHVRVVTLARAVR